MNRSLIDKPESKIEQTVCSKAKNLGWLVYKFTSPNQRGVPDRIFMRNGICFFVEFKKFGKKPTELQNVTMGKIKLIGGFECYVIDNIEDGFKLLEKYQN